MKIATIVGICVWLGCALATIGFWVGVIYIALHFVFKYW